MHSIFYRTVPVLIILIIIEAAFMIKEHRPSKKDTLSSIILALGHLPIAAITKGFVILFYSFIYQYRLFTLPIDFWWSWMICFFADDISYYWFHRISHQVRFFWASHKVHHSSETFTLSTGIRIPWTSDFSGNFLFWAWLPLIGIEPYMVIFMKSVSALYQFALHTETIKKLPRWIEFIFNTPSHHRVHHSSNVEYLDKNHAGTLILWDRLFGTFQPETFKPKYGLTEDIKSFNPFVIAFHEWKNIFQDIKRSKSIRDRLRYFYKAPGWSHDGTSKTTRQLQSELVSKKNKRTYFTFRRINIIAVLLLTSAIYTPASTQERKLFYDVIRNGNVIGNIDLTELKKDQKKFLSLTSEVKTRFIFSFTIQTSETAAYEDGIMVYSSFYEKKTGSGKSHKTTIVAGKNYKLLDGDASKLVSLTPIRYNMLLLYTNVPETINQVYSDNFQSLLDIKKMEDNRYKLTLPNGDHNYYTYKNGLCTKVDVERTLFTLQFVLREKIK